MPTREPRPTELGETLTRLREALGLSASEVARRAGITQPTLARWENGRGYPSADQMTALLGVLKPDRATRDRLRQLVRHPDLQRRVVHRSDAPGAQRQWLDLERSATRIVTFTPTVVPGLLQTDDYAQALLGDVLSGQARERWLDARRERRALIDNPGDRELVQITTAGALLWGLGGPAVMLEQLAHLADVAGRPGIRFGVVRPAVTADFIVLGGFDLYDTPRGRRVVVGTEAVVAVYDDARDVALHEAVLAGLERVAAWDAEAVPVLDELTRYYR